MRRLLVLFFSFWVLPVLANPLTKGLAQKDGSLFRLDRTANGDAVFQINPKNLTSTPVMALNFDAASGLEYRDNFFYLVSAEQGAVVKVNAATGLVEQRFTSANFPYTAMTLDQNFAYASIAQGVIYKLDLDSGKVVGSMIAPLAGPSHLATDGNSLWVAAAGSIYQLRLTDGAKLSQFAAPDANCRGLAWDNDSLWYAAEDGALHQLPIPTEVRQIEAQASPVPPSFAPVPGGPTP